MPDNRPLTFDHLRSQKKPLEAKVQLILNDDVIDAVNEAVASGNDEAIVAARQAAEEATVTFRLRSIGRKRFEALLQEHPPTDEDIAEVAEQFPVDAQAPGEVQAKQRAEQRAARPAYHAETFAPALLAKVCYDPVLDEAEWSELMDEWNTAEVMELFLQAMSVCSSRRVVPLGE